MLWQARQGLISGRAALDAVGASTEVTAFLARTSGLDATHINAYTALIDGLVADGVWAKLDMLHVYATQDATTALLNLVSTNYNGTTHGAPSFSADLGYTGVNASTTVYIDTAFTPSTASSPNFVRDSAHVSTWNLTNSTSAGIAIGLTAGGGSSTNIHPKFTDNNAYFRINGSSGTAGVAMADARGHLISNRSGASAVQGYKNGASVLTNSDASIVVGTTPFFTLAQSLNAGAASGTGLQIASTSIGASLNGTQAGNFYTRLRTYMTAVGVP